MSRTNRKVITDKNHREARKGRVNRRKAWDTLWSGFRATRGGMQMHPSNSGEWRDEMERSPNARQAEKQRQRRRDERTAMKDQEN